jgi:peptidoglycan/LPS O-acetylase OafA/YrhL
MVHLTLVSFCGLLILIIFYFAKNRRWQQSLLQLMLLAIAFLLIYIFFIAPKQATGRGDSSQDLYFVIVLYLFMLLGMLAQYIYARLEQPKAVRPKFDLGIFLAPIFTSPIIFIPLLSAMQNANIDLHNLTTPRLMVFLVAFENGFFWKELFDHRRRLKEAGKNE